MGDAADRQLKADRAGIAAITTNATRHTILRQARGGETRHSEPWIGAVNIARDDGPRLAHLGAIAAKCACAVLKVYFGKSAAAANDHTLGARALAFIALATGIEEKALRRRPRRTDRSIGRIGHTPREQRPTGYRHLHRWLPGHAHNDLVSYATGAEKPLPALSLRPRFHRSDQKDSRIFNLSDIQPMASLTTVKNTNIFLCKTPTIECH